jgi:hypothetical protein
LQFFPKLGYFAGLSLKRYIINFGGRISEATMGGEGARSALLCMLMSLKRRVHAAHGRACAAKIKYQLFNIFYLLV